MQLPPFRAPLRAVHVALIAAFALAGCGTLTSITDGIGGVFYGVSDDMRSLRR